MLHIGCHLSSTKGYLAMGQEALRIGADTFAFFTRNPRGGNAKPEETALSPPVRFYFIRKRCSRSLKSGAVSYTAWP